MKHKQQKPLITRNDSLNHALIFNTFASALVHEMQRKALTHNLVLGTVIEVFKGFKTLDELLHAYENDEIEEYKQKLIKKQKKHDKHQKKINKKFRYPIVNPIVLFD